MYIKLCKIYVCTVICLHIYILLTDRDTIEYKDYYLGYFNNFNGIPSIIFINNDTYPILYSIEGSESEFNREDRVAPNSTMVIDFPMDVTVGSPDDLLNGIHLRVGSCNVTLIGQDVRLHSTTTFLALPNVQLDVTHYVYYGMVITDSTTRSSVILVVGTDEGTVMNLTTTQPVTLNVDNGDTFDTIAGRQYSFVINELQTVYIATFTDLTGTKIVTNKPVSVFSGHECVLIPSTTAGCDHIVEQIPPTALWGNVFYISPLLTRRSYTIKVLAAYNNTDISLYCNGTTDSICISEGEAIVRTFMFQEYCAIHSTRSILVAQFSHGQLDDDADGDPMMMLIPAKMHYTNKFSLSTIRNPAISGYQHFLNIIVLARHYQPDMIHLKSGSVYQTLEVFSWIPIIVDDIIEAYALQVNISEGVAEVIHVDPTAQMAATVYGFGENEGYGHAFDLGVPKSTAGMYNLHIYIHTWLHR